MEVGRRYVVEQVEYECIGVDLRMGDTTIDCLLQDVRNPGTTRRLDRVHVGTGLWSERDQYFKERDGRLDVVGDLRALEREDDEDDTTEVTQPYGYPSSR